MDISDILDTKKCNCGRSYCEFFNPGLGEWGSSVPRYKLENALEELTGNGVNQAIEHLKNLLDIKTENVKEGG